MKTCKKCNAEKPLEKFDKTPSGNRRGQCNTCRTKARSSEYKKRKSEKGKAGAYRKQNLKKYGLTKEDYDELVKSQNNLCAICKTNDLGHHKKLFVDHDHKTNKVRGLLCLNCNSLLGHAKDSPHILERALAYLVATN